MSALKKMSAVMFAATAISLTAIGEAQAAALIPVSSVSTNMGNNTASGGYSIQNIINGSGMQANGHVTTNSSNSWEADPNVTTGEILFDLGNQYNIEEMKIWNNREQNGPNSAQSGIQNVSFATAQPGAVFSPLTFSVLPSSTLTLGSNSQGPQAPPDFNSLLPGNGVLARYIRFTVNSSYGSRAALAEVQFFGTPQAAIPTPALLPGLLGLGMAAARKRRAKSNMITA
jgi:hypothetical protein